MGINRLAGSPFQIGKLPNPEGRRARSRCIYYRKDGNSTYCVYRFGRCMGSAHCDYYKESNKQQLQIITNVDKRPVEQQAKSNYNKEQIVKNILIGEEMISPKGIIGKIVDVKDKIMFIQMPDAIRKIGFSALKNPPIGKWTAKDDNIQRYILHILGSK